MTRLFTQAFLISVIIFLAACNTASTDNKEAESTAAKETASFDLSAARTAIEAANSRFGEAFRKKDSVAIAALYTDDGWMLPPNSEPVKKPAMTSLWGQFIGMGLTDLKLITDEVSGNADQLAEVGHYELHAGDNKIADKGKYIVIWKPVNGEWKLHRDIWNTSMPAAPAK